MSSGGDWYLHPSQMSTSRGDDNNPIDNGDRIVSYDVPDRGWRRNRAIDSQGHRLVRLRRASDTAEEGVFTCDIPGDDNTPKYLGIYYLSEFW